jgi:hypothetical protein
VSTPELHGFPRTTGHPNGRPEFKPYVWDRTGEQRRRQAETNARLAALRARIQADIDAEQS